MDAGSQKLKRKLLPASQTSKAWLTAVVPATEPLITRVSMTVGEIDAPATASRLLQARMTGAGGGVVTVMQSVHVAVSLPPTLVAVSVTV